MSCTRIATEEAFATPDMFDCYRRIIDSRSLDDPGFYSLWGYFLDSGGERAVSIRRKLLDLDSERIRDMDDTCIGRQIISLT